jgi:hypothetical protein
MTTKRNSVIYAIHAENYKQETFQLAEQQLDPQEGLTFI